MCAFVSFSSTFGSGTNRYQGTFKKQELGEEDACLTLPDRKRACTSTVISGFRLLIDICRPRSPVTRRISWQSTIHQSRGSCTGVFSRFSTCIDISFGNNKPRDLWQFQSRYEFNNSWKLSQVLELCGSTSQIVDDYQNERIQLTWLITHDAQDTLTKIHQLQYKKHRSPIFAFSVSFILPPIIVTWDKLSSSINPVSTSYNLEILISYALDCAPCIIEQVRRHRKDPARFFFMAAPKRGKDENRLDGRKGATGVVKAMHPSLPMHFLNGGDDVREQNIDHYRPRSSPVSLDVLTRPTDDFLSCGSFGESSFTF